MPKRSVQDSEQDKFDSLGRGVTVIETLHRNNHEGWVHHAGDKMDGLLTAGSDELLIKVPAGVYPHVQRLTLSLGRGDVDVEIREGPVVSDDGTLVASLNTNRNSANTAEMLTYHTPTVTTPGALVHTMWVPPTSTGVGLSPQGIITREGAGEEWLLAPSTDYQITITNNSGATISWSWSMLWYEIDWATGVNS